MQGYFEETQKRFFFFYGQLNDEFCLPNLKIIGFEEVLGRYLKSIGYQRVIFYNGRKKLRFHDMESFELRNVNARANTSQSKQNRTSKIAPKKHSGGHGGPLGFKNINLGRQAANPTEPAHSNPGSSNLTIGMNDLEIINNLSAWMGQKDIKTAFVFKGIDFINHFAQQGRQQIEDVLEECSSYFSDNDNIIIFQFMGITTEHILEAIDRHQWTFLKSEIFKKTPDGKSTKQMIPISSPREDEIRNLLNYRRLVKQMPIDWLSFPQAVTQIARATCGDGRNLKDLHTQLKKEDSLNLQTFAKLAGQLEQQPAFERLKQLRGLEVVAERLESLIIRQKEELENRQPLHTTLSKQKNNTIDRLLPAPHSLAKGVNLHIALKGSPGTGKTESAKLIGEIYRDAGLLPLGHTVKVTRTDLVGGYVGQTALKTAQKIADAMGGVLFIDEAYSLIGEGNDFGQEAINTLVEAMTNYMGEFSVIIAGYPERIDEFIAANSGLQSRFSASNTLTISDYSPAILQYIFEQKVKKERRQIQPELQEVLPFLFENIYAERDEDFGNARDVMGLYQEMDEKRSGRIAKLPENNDKRLLTVADVPELYQKFLTSRQPEDLDSILNQLDHLVGLAEVKEAIRRFIKRIRVSRKKAQITGNSDANTQFTPGHYLFLGNPGTGKTTVARLMGEIFKNLGLLEKGNIIEVRREDLVGNHQGDTELKLKEVLERSFNNVLFIDEAYDLVQSEQDTVGKIALGSLVANMENHRDKLCIIAAGYHKSMETLLANNIGFKSRFNNTITFSNYNAREMLEIFLGMAKNLTLAEGVEEKLLAIFKVWEANQAPDFGNGRDVRNLFDMVLSNRDARIDELDESELIDNPHIFDTIELNDLPTEKK